MLHRLTPSLLFFPLYFIFSLHNDRLHFCFYSFFNKLQSSSVIRRTGEVADGKFRIGDIHESGGYNNDEKKAAALILLKRSQSTGDIDDEDKTDDAPYLDSDHSCCQVSILQFKKIPEIQKYPKNYF